LGAIVSAIGGRGAFLETSSTTPGLSVGWGALTGGPAALDLAQRADLRAHGEGVRSGYLWLDHVTRSPKQAIRAIELALEAAKSRVDARQSSQRLEALDAATRAIAGPVSLDRVLQDIADRVRELIGAEYAALGIVDEYGVVERTSTSPTSATR
jgi:hypothetical protein